MKNGYCICNMISLLDDGCKAGAFCDEMFERERTCICSGRVGAIEIIIIITATMITIISNYNYL